MIIRAVAYIFNRLNVHIFSHTTGIVIFSLLPSMKNEITFSVGIFVIEGKYSNVSVYPDLLIQ